MSVIIAPAKNSFVNKVPSKDKTAKTSELKVFFLRSFTTQKRAGSNPKPIVISHTDSLIKPVINPREVMRSSPLLKVLAFICIDYFLSLKIGSSL